MTHTTHVIPTPFAPVKMPCLRRVAFTSWIRASIPSLLNGSCPTAIFGRVIPVRKNPVKSFPIWARAHIKQEIRKTVFPAAANPNAASTVEMKTFIPLVVAARAHRKPTAIRGAVFRLAVNKAVSMNSHGDIIHFSYGRLNTRPYQARSKRLVA